MPLIFSIAVFIAALILIVWKPCGLREAYPALAGAALLFAFRLLAPADAAYIWSFVWDATFSLIGIMLFTSLLDQNGFFRWAALHIVRRFHRRQVRLLVGLSLLAACITVFFNNDGTILIMTPIALEVTALLKLPRKAKIAFLFSVGLMADTASAPLMMSNLTNILTADFFGISFGDYAKVMLIPGMTAIVATVGMTALVFGRTIRREENREEAPHSFPAPGSAIGDKRLFAVSWIMIGVMMAGYLVSGRLHLPVMAVALVGAALQWAASAALGKANFRQTVRRAPWLIVVFALSMNLIVYSLYLHGAVGWFPDALGPVTAQGAAAGIFGSGVLFSLLAAAVNNLPAVLVSSLSIGQLGGGPSYLPFASLLGTAVGAKLTPIGSLATLLWLQLISRGGAPLTWKEYVKYGLTFTFPILFCALFALWLVCR
ncbi:ArsB/NhaD family transporter [Paenibacillus humicola]|uniref:ArsB/NhaD family transporter n=1 Tax=Paenibacillus humicola TaxID=3110540 RepID=UPI00237B6FC1|nr:ArsB/NhaD family transporter [Paenibacillus humicola]